MSYVETKLVSLSSNSATTKNNGTFLSDVEFYTKGLLVLSEDIERVEVACIHCEIPVSFYNINYTCNQIRFQLNSGSITTATIAVGNYNAYTLITELTQVINALITPVILAISINKVAGIFTFFLPLGNTMTLYGDTTIANILPFLGFEIGNNYTSVVDAIGVLIVAPYPCNLLGITRLNVLSSELATFNYSSTGGSTSYLASIPVDQPSYGLIVYENKSMIKNSLLLQDIYKIDIQIRDQFYNLVNFNNTDWSILFCLFITRNPLKETIPFLPPSKETPTKKEEVEVPNKDVDALNILSQ